MPASITINYPMPAAQLDAAQFNVCGTAVVQTVLDRTIDRNATMLNGITVTLSLGGVVLYSVPGLPCASAPGHWKATFTNIAPATDYIVTASIPSGNDLASNSIETVDVVNNPKIVILQPPACCAAKVQPQTLLKFGARAAVAFSGTYNLATATGVLGVVQQIATVFETTAHSGGGFHYHIRFSSGSYVRYALGNLLNATDWDLTIDLEPDMYVVVYLEEGTEYPAFTSSQLF